MTRFLALILPAAFAVSCTTVSSRPVTFPDHPVSLRVSNRIIDEDNTEHIVRFRNAGTQVLSFDYTIADQPGVPHVDAAGPNSGYVKNLYPGEEREVPNPWKKMGVFVSLGAVTYGKQSEETLQKTYRPDLATPAAANPAGSAADLFGTPPAPPAAPPLP
jgi:hypothetical protein